jgi:chromosome segregation ATPase
MEIGFINSDLEKICALEQDLEKLRKEERIIERYIDEYFSLLRSEPHRKEHMTRKIEHVDKVIVGVKEEISKISMELNRLEEEVYIP